MEQRFLNNVLANNWYLFIILAVVLVMAAIGMMIGEEAEEGPPQRGPAVADGATSQPQVEPQFVFGRRTERSSPEAQAKATIAKHQKTFEENPDADDAAGLLSAMGNIYMQKLGKLEEAAQNYERILIEYPDWVGINTVYPQLVICYEKLDDDRGRRWIYKRILQDYPPESEEYKYCQAQMENM